MKQFIVAGLLLGLAACASPNTTSGTAQTGAVASTSPADIQGKWKVTSIRGEAVPENVEVSMDFADGRVAGGSGCNRFHSGVDLGKDGAFSAAQVAGTMMACMDPQMSVESKFLAQLQATKSFAVADGVLTLSSPDGGKIEARRP